MNKKLPLLLIFAFLLVVPLFSAIGITYESNDLGVSDMRVKVSDTTFFGLIKNEEIGSIELKSHKNIYEKRVVEINTLTQEVNPAGIGLIYETNFNEEMLNGLTNVKIIDMKTKKEVQRDWRFVYSSEGQWEIPIYKEVCPEIKEIFKEDSEEIEWKSQNCEWVFDYYDYSPRKIWNVYDSQTIPSGKFELGIEIEVKKSDNLDIVLEVGNKSLTKHAQVIEGIAEYIYAGGYTNQSIIKYDKDLNIIAVSPNYGGLINSIAIDEDYVYYVGDTTRTVRKAYKTNLTTIADSQSYGGDINSIAIDDNYVYYGGYTTNKVRKAYKTNLSTIVDSPNYGNYIISISLDDNYVYYGGATTQKVIKAYKTNLSTIVDSPDYGGEIRSITLDDNYVYYGGATTQKVIKAYKTNLSTIVDSPDYGGEIRSITLDDNYVYYGGYLTKTVRKAYKTNLTTIADSPNYGGHINSIAIDDNYVYYGGYTTNKVRKAYKTNLTTIADSPNYGGPIYSIAIDTTPPTILITSGNGTQNYGDISTNHTLNITFTDTNLDNCWINYNGTNQTFDCTSGVDSPVNFTLQYNLYNATIWANDTLGNENSSFVSWDYRVFENNRTFNNETLSGSIEDFSINVTLGNETEIVSAIFVYNGTNTSSVITSIGNFRLITIDDFEIPIFSSSENISFYWEILLSDGTNFSTYTSTHLVSVLKLDNCSTYTFQLANISLFDEETLQLIRGDIEVYYSILNKPKYNSIKNLSGIFENISNTLICSDINLSNQNLAYSTEIRYSSEKGLFDDVGYAKEFYHIQRSDIGELIKISLYDLHLNETTEFEIEYQNEDLVRVANAIVQLQRKYIAEDIYRVVEAPITSNEGTAVLHIDLNTNKYKITIIKDGVVLDIFDNLVFVCDNVLSGQCEQKLYGSIDPTNDIPIETIQDFSYTLSEVNNTITIDFSIPSGVPSNINFLMYQSDQFGTTTLCNRTIISSAGSTSCIYNNTITDSYLDLILTRDGNVIFSRTYIVQEADGVDFLDNNFFIVFIFLISIVGMAFTSPEWIIMNSVIVFVISGALWLLNGMNFVMGLGGLAWLILGAGILIFKLTKQEDR